MNKLDTQYIELVKTIFNRGEWENTRTGLKAKTYPSFMLTHNMKDGFPLITIKKTPFKVMAVELEGFIKGITSKKWYQDRKCNIWDEWCNPQKVKYSTDPIIQEKMKKEDDLGLIYGSQWRDFHTPNAYYRSGYNQYGASSEGYVKGRSTDQLKTIINQLKNDPTNRRMVCSAWNPLSLDYMALPPCHVLWQVSVINNKLNLTWYQRSCDVPLGIPFNIASYALLLHLLAKEAKLEEGILTGFLNNVHFYENQLDGVKEMLFARNSEFELPTIETNNFESILYWKYSDTKLINYQSLPKIDIPIAV